MTRTDNNIDFETEHYRCNFMLIVIDILADYGSWLLMNRLEPELEVASSENIVIPLGEVAEEAPTQDATPPLLFSEGGQ